MEKISVAVRFQPPNPIPTPAGASSTSDGGDREWRIKDAHVSLLHCTFFAFDHVFDAAATNARVIRAAVDGCNGTVFAYGQTSSGKTHTMSGSGADPGVIPLAVRDLFDTASQAVDREFCFKVPYMEIYNEDINDLLTLGSEKLQIRDNLKHEACVGGLREDVVESAEETLGIVNLGEAKRHFGQTNMNVQSSRSHTIFRMIIESRAKNKMDSGDAIRVSVLNLVDLAGSERTSKTGAEGVRLKEGKFINKSLMNLGIVINKLSENGKKMGHIPYRHSKLTRILEPALGGNAKTSIICTAAPEEIHIDETKGTLQFASRAKCVSNCAQVNEILTDAVLIERQKQKIQELRKRLQGSDSEAMKQVVVKQCNGIRKYKLELDGLTMELEQERKSWEEERILRETLEHQLTMENKTIEDLKKTSTSSDQFTSSIEAAPADEEQDCSSVRRQALETELELLRKENSLLLQELSSSKEEAGCAAAKMQELEARCQKLENDRVADREEAEEECNLLKEETSCLLLELSRCKQEAGRLAAEKQAQLDELMARCAALREEKTFLAQELELSRCAAREAGNLAAEKLAALEEALSASGREAEHLAAENRVPAEELGAEKRRRSAEAAGWEVPLNADDSV